MPAVDGAPQARLWSHLRRALLSAASCPPPRRKGTAAEVIDHPLLRAPFSAGARMCPGNKIANFELLTMVAQLVQVPRRPPTCTEPRTLNAVPAPVRPGCEDCSPAYRPYPQDELSCRTRADAPLTLPAGLGV